MINLIKNSLLNIKAHKLRFFMAIFWIVLGITSVTVMSSIGKGVEYKIQQSIEKVANKSFSIEFEPTAYNGIISGFLEAFTEEDIQELIYLEG